jgi:hypothetical protein
MLDWGLNRIQINRHGRPAGDEPGASERRRTPAQRPIPAVFIWDAGTASPRGFILVLQLLNNEHLERKVCKVEKFWNSEQ